MASMLSRRIRRVCERKLKRGNLATKEADAVRAVISDRQHMADLTDRVHGLATFHAVGAVGETGWLKWLMDHWKEILAAILAIIAAL